MRLLNRLFSIREGEGKPLILLFTYFFFFGATLTVSKTARDAYFLSRFDVTYLPLMFLATACAIALTVPVYTTVSKRLGFMPVVSLSGFVFAITLILIQFNLEGGIIPFLYVWVDVITTVISVQFWILAATVFNSRQAKRLFSIILAGSPLARITIGAGIKPFIERFGSDYLLSLAAGFVLCCVLMAWLAKPDTQKNVSIESPQEKQTGKSGFLDNYLKMIAVAVGATAVATVIIEYQFLIIASNHFHSEEQLASFFGIFYSLTGVISLFMQLFLTGWILTRFNIQVGMMALPVGLGVGVLAILISPLLLMSTLIAKTSEQITKFTVNKASFELLWLPVSPERKLNSKLFVDGTIRTGLQGLTGIVIFIFLKVWQLPYPQLMQVLCLVAFLSIGIWTLSVSRLKKGYVAELMAAIEKRRLDFKQMRLDTTDSGVIDSGIIITIEEALNRDDEAQQVFALGLIEGLDLSPWRETLNSLFQTGSTRVQQKILEMAAVNPETLTDAELRKKIEEQGPHAGDAIILAGKRGMLDVLPTLRYTLENSKDSTRDIQAASATSILIMNQEPFDLARSILEDLLNSEDESLKVLALQRMLHIPPLIKDIKLRECLESDSIRVCAATLDIAQQKSNVQLLPGIINCMKHSRTAEKARSVLKAYPSEDVVAVLSRICVDSRTPLHLKIEIIKTLKGYPDPDAVLCLLRMMEQSPPNIQMECVNALLEIARINPLSVEILHQLSTESAKIAREIYAYCELLNMIIADPDSLLLRDLFESNIQESTPILFTLLLLHKPETPVEAYLAYFKSEDVTQLANLFEILENILPKRESSWIIPLIKPMSVKDRSREGQKLFSDLPRNLEDELLQIMLSPNEWHAAVALDYVLRQGQRVVLEQVDWMSFPDHKVQHELISRYLLQNEGLFENLPQFPRAYFLSLIKEEYMLSILEKTIILKGTGLFEDIPGEEIYHAAQLMVEERLARDALLFQKGDVGEYLYVIVTGEILIHIEDKEFRRHHKGDYFGEMALLDDTLRSASATALEETLLLKISQDDFLDIMMDYKEVIKNIMKTLNARFRELTDRYAEIP